MSMAKRFTAELLGTAWLVFGGCGSAVLAAAFTTAAPASLHLGIGFTGVALAFGLTLLTMVYTIGPISGCHINPAVSCGLWAGGRFPASDLPAYIAAQVLGGLIGAAVLYAIASGTTGFNITGGFASNGFGEHSPGSYSLLAALIAEVVLTYFFLLIILGSTSPRAPAGFAGIAIGLALVLIHLISVPVSNTSVNPARSTGPAVILALNGPTWAVQQLWLFWVAPIVGAVLAGFTFRWLGSADE